MYGVYYLANQLDTPDLRVVKPADAAALTILELVADDVVGVAFRDRDSIFVCASILSRVDQLEARCALDCL